MKKGFTVVELIASFTLAIIIAVLMFQVVLVLKGIFTNSGLKTQLLNKQALISDNIYRKIIEKGISTISKCGTKCLRFTYLDNTTSDLVFEENKLAFEDYKFALDNKSSFGPITVEVEKVSVVSLGNPDSILQIKLPIYNTTFENQDFGINIVYQFSSSSANITSLSY